MPIDAGEPDPAFDMMAAQARQLAHAIGNPLAGLSLSLELLEQTEMQPAQARYVSRCRHACERLLADQALLAAVGGARQHAPGWHEVAVFIDRALSDARRAAPDRAASGDNTRPACLEIGPHAERVWAVAPLLQESLCVLVANASEAAGAQGEVGVRTERRGPEIVFHVWDSGPGVAADQVASLFRARRTDKPRGVGLGLMRAALLIERYQGGRLWHTPRTPQGAMFSIALPIPAEGHSPWG